MTSQCSQILPQPGFCLQSCASFYRIERDITELEKTVISLKVHKSIYRRMFLRLEIDFKPVCCEGYYGTGIGERMRLKNVLLVVEDIEQSKRFYHDLFGLRTLADFGGNVVLTEGLALQDRSVWERLVQKETVYGDGDMELYFEENHLDAFLEKLNAYPEPVRYFQKPVEHAWGQRVVRLYDPDGHVIEVGEAMDFVARRFYEAGMSLEEVSEKTQLPLAQVTGICQGEPDTKE